MSTNTSCSRVAIVSETEQAHGVGVEALSHLRRQPHGLLGWLQSASLVSGWASRCARAAAHVLRLSQDVLGAVGAAGGAQGRGSWYGREVQRSAVDHWQHLGTSLRRTAEVLRSWMGRLERWLMWRPLDEVPHERCYLAASTVHRWVDWAGRRAQASVDGQLTGIGEGKVLGTEGLWTKFKGKAQRVVLLVVDSVSGLIYPPVVAKGEESEGPWQRLFARAQQAGLDPSDLSPQGRSLEAVRAVTSDGAQGLQAYLRVASVAQPGRRTVPGRQPSRSRPHRRGR